jgi:hypothetical protein
VPQRSTDRDEQHPPAAGTAPGGGSEQVGDRLERDGLGQTSWLEVIRHINSNPIVVYDRIVRQRRAGRFSSQPLAFVHAVVYPVGLLMLAFFISALIARFAPPGFHINPFAEHDEGYEYLLKFGLMTAFFITIIPTAYRCATSAVQFLAQGRRLGPASPVNDLLDISLLSDREILAGFIYTRLAPLWRALGCYSFLFCAIAYFVYVIPLYSMVYRLYYYTAHAFSEPVDWLIRSGELTRGLIAIPIFLVMWLGLVLASLLWFSFYICLGRHLPNGPAITIAAVSMVCGQMLLWAWLLLCTDFEYVQYVGSYELTNQAALAQAAFCIVALVLTLALAARYWTIRYAFAFALPVIVLAALMLWPRIASRLLYWYDLPSLHNEWLNPSMGVCYTFGISHIFTGLVYSIQHGSYFWLAPCGILLLAQLVQVWIVLSFATEAVHSRRQRPA